MIEVLEPKTLLTNHAPVGASTTVTTLEDNGYTFATADFGYSDPNDVPANVLLGVKITTLPVAGTLFDRGIAVTPGQVVSAIDIRRGDMEFLPAANGNGNSYAAFTFQVQDDGGTAGGGIDLDLIPKTLTVNVTPVNDAPLGVAKTVTTQQEVPYAFATADFGFSDPNDTPANALKAVKITTLPVAGSLKNNGVTVTTGQFVSAADISGGKLVFTPATGASGTPYTTFTFQVQDDGGTANGGIDLDQSAKTLTVNVTPSNHAPVGADGIVTTLEDGAYTFATTDFGFSDPSDTPANALKAVKITTLPVIGSLTDNGVAVTAGQFVSLADISGGKLVFTPAANANGNGYASFTFQVQDDGGTANGGVDLDAIANTLTVNVTAVNDAPVGTPTTVTGRKNIPFTFATTDFGFTDPVDAAANTLAAVKITTLPTAGTLTNNGVTVTAGQFVSVSDISSGKLVFTPALNASGNPYSSFTFQVQDDGGTANGGVDLDSTARQMTINVGLATSLNGSTLTVSGTSGADVITVTEGASLVIVINGVNFSFNPASVTTVAVFAYGGNDSVTLNSLNSGKAFLADGGDGDDTILVNSLVTVPTSLYGGNGNDTLTGGSGNDRLYDGTGTNVLNGGNGDDAYFLTPRTVVGTDKDTLIDSSGTDGLSFSSFSHDLTLNMQVAGAKTVDPLSGFQVDVTGGTFEKVYLGSGNDNVTGYASIGTAIDAGAGNDTLTGGSGNDRLYAGAGTNVLNGGSGDDSYFLTQRTAVGTDKDTVIDPSGTDGISFASFTHDVTFSLQAGGTQAVDASTGYQVDLAGATFEKVYLGSGNDIVTGNATLATAIDGGAGNDTLTGGSGNDRLYGGTGTNVLTGGTGDDAYFLSARTVVGTDKDTVIDSSGTDGVSFALFTNSLTVSLQAAGAQTVDPLTGYKVDLTGGTFEKLYFGSGNDVVTGNATLGTAIDGGAGNDTLTGGTGNDALYGGTGTNVLDGGNGDDAYYLTQRTVVGTDKDTVIDSSGTDGVSFSSFTHSLTFSLQAAAVQTVDPLTGYQVDVTGGTFEKLYFGSGNDIVTGNATLATAIDGGAGNNILIGGSGNDRLIGGSGRDILIGNAGLDSLTGNGEDDLLIGGIASYSGNLNALTAIRNEWTSANSYQTRVDHLRGTVGGGANTIAGGASGDFFLTSLTVTDDGVKDTFVGGLGNDWFWALGLDTTDQGAGELSN